MKRLFFALTAAAGLWTAACGGGGGSNVQPPPPQGKYSLASLNGTYAFMTSGEVVTAGGEAPMARVGSFVANGQGGILGGIEDVVVSTQLNSIGTITGGSYTVSANGFGSITLNVTSGGVPSALTFGITLTSTSSGLLVDVTSSQTQASTGSGNFVLQNEADCSNPVAAVTGSYVFDFSGLDASGAGASLIGEFTVSGGAITTGFTDVNDNFALTNGAIQGSFANDSVNPAGTNSCGRGVANIAGQNYEYYVVDPTRIRFISIGTGAMLTGDAVAQSANVPTSTASFNGGFVFSLAGSSNNGGITEIGRFSASGGNVSNVLADVDNAGALHPSTAFSGGTITFDAANPGRGTITFTNNSFPFTFTFYLSSATSGVIQDTSETTAGSGLAVDIVDGSIAAQSGSPFSNSNITGTYAMNWSGLVTAGGAGITDEEDLVAQENITSGSLSGTADLFQFTSSTVTPQINLGVGGSIQFSGDGAGDDGMRSQLTVNLTGANPITFVIYFVNPQQAFFAINSGQTHLDSGILQLQQ